MFAKQLEINLKERFPQCMTGKFEYAAGNYLDPVFKGVHLHAFKEVHLSAFDKTKAQLELLVDRISPSG